MIGIVNVNPVRFSHNHLTVSDRHMIVLVTLAGRECHERTIVPATRMILRPVMIWRGQTARRSHIGVISTMRMIRVVMAGAMVEVVGVRPVDRNWVSL